MTRRDRDRVIAWFDENHPDLSHRFIDDYSSVVYVLAVNYQGRDPASLNRASASASSDSHTA